jgi:hypothetical protein
LILLLALACKPSSDSDAPPTPDPSAGWVVATASIGPEGGSIELIDGSVLTLPEGALTEELEIRVSYPEALAEIDPGYRVWSFEPDGLVLAEPASFEFPLPEGADALLVDGLPAIQVWHVGSANTLVDLGSELSMYDAAPVEVTATHATVELAHFSVVEATREVDKIGYITTDIPPRYLTVGDVYFTLTTMGIGVFQNKKDGPNWAPGHVGVLSPVAGNQGRIIEATPPQIVASSVSEFNSDPGHLTLGPHRPIPPLANADLTAVRGWLDEQIGGDYNSVFGLGGINSYSCVGLAEKMLDEVGKGTVSWGDEVTGIMAPLYLHRRMRPVRAFRVVAGEYVRVPIHGVRVADESFKPGESPPWEYYCGCDYQLSMPSLPANAALIPDSPVSGSGTALSTAYALTWQTYPEDAGRTVDFPMEMSFELDLGGATAPILLADTLTIEVVAPQGGTVVALVLAADLTVEGLVYPAGIAISLTSITGGTPSGPDAGCSGDHLHGPSITIDGLGPIPDPDPTGCGYGRIVDYPEELLDP